VAQGALLSTAGAVLILRERPALLGYAGIVLFYLVGSVSLPLVARATKTSRVLPPIRTTALIADVALTSCAAYLAVAAGQATGSVALVIVLSSLASAVTVVLGLVFLKQRVAMHGWLGLTAIVMGLAALHVT
jgi:drug/metabolite transporter (DMT)-like permease